MSTIYILFNEPCGVFGQNNDWEKFGPTLDSLRMFLLCADSWRRHGWTVKRISRFDPEFTPRPYTGRINACSWYPAPYWQELERMRQETFGARSEQIFWFAQADIFNNGLYASSAAVMNPHALGHDGFATLQKETFTLAALATTREGLDNICRVIRQYDQGELPEIQTTYVGADRIVREHLEDNRIPLMSFPASCSGTPALIHYARSSLKPHFNTY